MTIEEQAKNVRKVKTYEAEIVSFPVTVTADLTIADAIALSEEKGFSGFPVTDAENGLVGIVTSRDMRFETKLEQPVSTVMTKKDKLVTVKEGAAREEILGLMHEHRIEKILVVDDAFKLKGMIIAKNYQKTKDKPP